MMIDIYRHEDLHGFEGIYLGGSTDLITAQRFLAMSWMTNMAVWDS